MLKVCFLVCAEDNDKKEKNPRKLIEAVKAFFQLRQAYWILWMKPPQFFLFFFWFLCLQQVGCPERMLRNKGPFWISLYLFCLPSPLLLCACLSLPTWVVCAQEVNETTITLKIKYNSVGKDINCHYKSVLSCPGYILSKP